MWKMRKMWKMCPLDGTDMVISTVIQRQQRPKLPNLSPVENADHLVDAFGEQGGALHFIHVVFCFVSLHSLRFSVLLRLWLGSRMWGVKYGQRNTFLYVCANK